MLTNADLAAEYAELKAEAALIRDRMDDIRRKLGTGEHAIAGDNKHRLKITMTAPRRTLCITRLKRYVTNEVLNLCVSYGCRYLRATIVHAKEKK